MINFIFFILLIFFNSFAFSGFDPSDLEAAHDNLQKEKEDYWSELEESLDNIQNEIMQNHKEKDEDEGEDFFDGMFEDSLNSLEDFIQSEEEKEKEFNEIWKNLSDFEQNEYIAQFQKSKKEIEESYNKPDEIKPTYRTGGRSSGGGYTFLDYYNFMIAAALMMIIFSTFNVAMHAMKDSADDIHKIKRKEEQQRQAKKSHNLSNVDKYKEESNKIISKRNQ